MSSNFPPGVSESDVPGNRLEDLRGEAFWEAYFDRLIQENGTRIEDIMREKFGEFWSEDDAFMRCVELARDMGYSEGVHDGIVEEQMAHMAEECIRCGYAHSVQEYCHCGECDFSHGPDLMDCPRQRMVD